MTKHQMGVTRACGLIGISRSLYRYEAKRPVDQELKERLCELAAQKRRYGYRRLHVLLCREGWEINRKRTYRVYHEAGLMVRKRKRKRIAGVERQIKVAPSAPNESWSMDYVRIVPTLQRGNAAGDAPASQHHESTSISPFCPE
ncbi:IS3 family transposase [Methylococcus mesophilus]|uniref:IS3 family transposase n=1 Tax=Methylococcus mesophilus TaxID=2993564 RepID=UPI00224AC119|nr:IS3 family transposase [Methylococcus mesophilus]UZR27416.1 IS3 family transposase [Methylococcus mesophilus]